MPSNNEGQQPFNSVEEIDEWYLPQAQEAMERAAAQVRQERNTPGSTQMNSSSAEYLRAAAVFSETHRVREAFEQRDSSPQMHQARERVAQAQERLETVNDDRALADDRVATDGSFDWEAYAEIARANFEARSEVREAQQQLSQVAMPELDGYDWQQMRPDVDPERRFTQKPFYLDADSLDQARENMIKTCQWDSWEENRSFRDPVRRDDHVDAVMTAVDQFQSYQHAETSQQDGQGLMSAAEMDEIRSVVGHDFPTEAKAANVQESASRPPENPVDHDRDMSL